MARRGLGLRNVREGGGGVAGERWDVEDEVI